MPASTSAATASPLPEVVSSSSRSFLSREAAKMDAPAGLAPAVPLCTPACSGGGVPVEIQLRPVHLVETPARPSSSSRPCNPPCQPDTHHSGVAPALLHKVARPPALLHAPLVHRSVHASSDERGVIRRPPQAAHLGRTAGGQGACWYRRLARARPLTAAQHRKPSRVQPMEWRTLPLWPRSTTRLAQV